MGCDSGSIYDRGSLHSSYKTNTILKPIPAHKYWLCVLRWMNLFPLQYQYSCNEYKHRFSVEQYQFRALCRDQFCVFFYDVVSGHDVPCIVHCLALFLRDLQSWDTSMRFAGWFRYPDTIFRGSCRGFHQALSIFPTFPIILPRIWVRP